MRVSEDAILNFIKESGVDPKDLRKLALARFTKNAEGIFSDLMRTARTSSLGDLFNFSPVQSLNPKQIKLIQAKMSKGTATPEEIQAYRRYYKSLRSRFFASDYKHDITKGMPNFMRSKQMGLSEEALASPEFNLYEKLRTDPYLNPAPKQFNTYMSPYTGTDERGFKRVLPFMMTTETPMPLNLQHTQGGY